jgi:hypothetical protein
MEERRTLYTLISFSGCSKLSFVFLINHCVLISVFIRVIQAGIGVTMIWFGLMTTVKRIFDVVTGESEKKNFCSIFPSISHSTAGDLHTVFQFLLIIT